MGLFGFESKTCAVCGKSLGLFGGKGIDDDEKICRECLSEVSPWMSASVRKNMTGEQMREHISYRLDNKRMLYDFMESNRLQCKNFTIAVDETNRWMVISRNPDYRAANADIIPIDQITKATFEICENKYSHQERDPHNEMPPRQVMRYQYYFKFYIYVNHLYVPVINFHVDASAIELMENANLRSAYNHATEIYQEFERLGISCTYLDNTSFGIDHILSGEAEEWVRQDNIPYMTGVGAGVGMARPQPYHEPPRPAVREPIPYHQPQTMHHPEPVRQAEPIRRQEPMHQAETMHRSQSMQHTDNLRQPQGMQREQTMQQPQGMQREQSMYRQGSRNPGQSSYASSAMHQSPSQGMNPSREEGMSMGQDRQGYANRQTTGDLGRGMQGSQGMSRPQQSAGSANRGSQQMGGPGASRQNTQSTSRPQQASGSANRSSQQQNGGNAGRSASNSAGSQTPGQSKGRRK